jgi:hypothetical protein
MENLMLDDPALMVRTLGVAGDGMVMDGPSAAQLPAFFAEAFGFVQKIEDELQAGVVHLTGAAKVLDTAELAQALGIKQGVILGGGSGGSDETLLLVVEDGLGIDA